jgi:hypothetical protein
MMTDDQRMKPGVAFWPTVVVVFVVAYVPSIGPFIWLDVHGLVPQSAAPACIMLYKPVFFAGCRSDLVRGVINQYTHLWYPDGRIARDELADGL